MSPNRIANTGIVAKSWNSRGLITHMADTRALVRQSDGTLWAGIAENARLSLYRSTDSGFSWERVWTDDYSVGTLPTANTNGPHIHLQVFEAHNRLIFWHRYLFWVFNLSAGTKITNQDASIVGDGVARDVPYSDNRIWLLSVRTGNLTVAEYRPTRLEMAEPVSSEGGGNPLAAYTKTGTFYDFFQGVAHEDGYVDIVAVEEGTGTTMLRHVRYSNGVFGDKHTIVSPGAVDISDVSIARDGYDNLTAIWTQANANDTDVDVYFAISKTGGATWNAPTKLERQVGHTAYRDPASARLTGRSTVLGGRQGFMLSWVHNNASEVPKTFVASLITADGDTYELGAPREIATQAALPDEPVVGLRWFRPPATSLMDIADPGLVRVAFQIGEGNSQTQNDSVPVRFGQELLSESAYPSSLKSESGSYVTEAASSIQLQVNFNVLGAPNSNTDYHALGLTGRVTNRYTAAFKRAGIELRFQRFDPIPEAEMDDRSAYGAPVEFTSVTVMEPHTYDNPLAQRGNDSYESHIERDVRRIFVPASMHFSREWVLNKGFHLKRTVWVVSFDGNEYEISQVVPYFVNGVIAYYGANARVIGPSHDPFSARRLPSET